MGGHQEKLQETQESSAAENSWRVLGTITLYVCPLILPYVSASWRLTYLHQIFCLNQHATLIFMLTLFYNSFNNITVQQNHVLLYTAHLGTRSLTCFLY